MRPRAAQHDPAGKGTRRPSTVWFAACCLGALVAVGCPVDERTLEPLPGLTFVGGEAGEGGVGGTDSPGGVGGTSGPGGDSGEGGTGHAGEIDAGRGGSAKGGKGGAAGSGPPAGNGGLGAGMGGKAGKGGNSGCEAGESSCAGAGGGSGGMVVGRCPDLDMDGVLDCEESVVQNPTFDLNPDGWVPETNLGLTWSEEDGLGHEGSGSLGAENMFEADMEGSLMVGASQCMIIAGGAVYHYYMQANVPADAGGTQAGFQVIYYDNTQCTGVTIDIAASNMVGGPGWDIASLTYPTPFGAKSAAVRIIVLKPYRTSPVTTLFDNVLVRPR